MKTFSLTGFVIHTRAYRETSLLVNFFTYEQGLVSAVAKGVKRPKSDKKSLLQPMQLLGFDLVGKGDLKTLSSIESKSKILNITQQRLYSAFYLNEIISRTLQDYHPVEAVFSQYQQSLYALARTEAIEPILRTFEFELLNELGLLPDFLSDAETGESIQNNSFYTLWNNVGFVETQITYDKNPYTAKGNIIERLRLGQWDPEVLSFAKRINRLLLNDVLGSKPLKSRELFL